MGKDKRHIYFNSNEKNEKLPKDSKKNFRKKIKQNLNIFVNSGEKTYQEYLDLNIDDDN